MPAYNREWRDLHEHAIDPEDDSYQARQGLPIHRRQHNLGDHERVSAPARHSLLGSKAENRKSGQLEESLHRPLQPDGQSKPGGHIQIQVSHPSQLLRLQFLEQWSAGPGDL